MIVSQWSDPAYIGRENWIQVKYQREISMRYFCYHNNEKQPALETKAARAEYKTARGGELIIDDDTVYEIDKDCVRCKEEKKNQ